jgi:integrase
MEVTVSQIKPVNSSAALSEVITAYLGECRTFRHLADSTVQRYEVSLRKFARPLVREDKYLPLLAVPKDAWREWVLEADHLSNKAFNGRRSHLAAFIGWLVDEGLMSATEKPLKGVRERPNTTLRPKTYVKAEHVPAVLDAAEAWHVRDRYFCEALWESWRRSGELTALHVRDVDLKPYPDSPHGRLSWENFKTHRPNQVLDMSPGLQDCLSRWLAVYEELTGEKPRPSWFLFPALRPEGQTIAGRRRRLVLAPELPIGQPDSIARAAFKRAGVYQLGAACHAFRRGAADHLYDMAAEAGHKNPLRLAMTALDHKSEGQTESYLDKSRDRRDLATFLHEQTQPADVPASGADSHQDEPEEQGAAVVSLASWRSHKSA